MKLLGKSSIALLSAFSINAMAHPAADSMMVSMFGQNLTHWLLAHQGMMLVAAVALLASLCIAIKQSRKAQKAENAKALTQ